MRKFYLVCDHDWGDDESLIIATRRVYYDVDDEVVAGEELLTKAFGAKESTIRPHRWRLLWNSLIAKFDRR